MIGLRFLSDGRQLLQRVSVLGVSSCKADMGTTWASFGPIDPVFISSYILPIDYWNCIQGAKHRG